MCGIAGIYNLDGAPVDASVLNRMVDLQRHRGPDDSGARLFSLRKQTSFEVCGTNNEIHCGGLEGGLGFTRLSILDLSERGHQPMANEDGSVFIAFNGEIYNAFSFKAGLQDAGYRFRSTSDTEVILRLYEHYGLEGLVDRINGMFSIAIVDLRERAVMVVRDGTGIKPMYWAQCNNTVLFGSEIKSFLAHPDFECWLAEENLDEYMAFRYCAQDRHLLKGVHQLRPGHYMRFAPGQPPVVSRFYTIPDRPMGATAANGNMVDELEERLRSAVQSHLLADVKVGCQLSGGIDSSLTTLYASEHAGRSIEAFSVVFRDPKYSESPWMAQAAQVAQVDSHNFLFTSQDFFESFAPATWHLEQPINHPNTLGLYLLAKKSRPMVKVLLSGEGADELMGGYSRFYYGAVRSAVWPALPLLERLPYIGEKWKRNFGTGIKDPIQFFISASMHMRPDQLSTVRPNAKLDDLLEQRRVLFGEGQGDYLSNCMKYEMQSHMVDLLLRQDRMTMAHSLEARVPFLDRELVGFVRSLPASLLIGDDLPLWDRRMKNTKKLLKTLASKYFPKKFVYRPKSGFTLPLLDYYQDQRFSVLMNESILPGISKRGLMDVRPIRQWWENVQNMPRTLDETYWVPIAFELWAQQWLDGVRGAMTQPNYSSIATAGSVAGN